MTRRTTTFQLGLLAVILLTIAVPSRAATCTINTAPSFNFGNYDPFAAMPLDMTSVSDIVCWPTNTGNESVTVAIMLSTGSAGTFNPRKMQRQTLTPLDTLNYNLYSDSTRSQILGDGTGGTITDVRTVTAQQNHPGRVTETIYGRIFANQDPSIGSYSDTIIYTVNF